MSVRRLSLQVGTLTNVHADSVFFHYAGFVLDMDRLMSDPPTIREGARVHAFFSVTRALQYIVHLLQGGGQPPTTPPALQPFGPTLPLGYARPQYPPSPTQSPALGSGFTKGTSSLSDKLRSTFKCPKFLGEVRHWKGWNQGCVRFFLINKLDHVIDEKFLLASLSPEQQDENKLVYYILEDAVSSSAGASKYVRRAVVWNGHEAYYLFFDGFALSGPATAAILLGELSNFRFKTDQTPSEVCSIGVRRFSIGVSIGVRRFNIGPYSL
jgi:hypothetical protein